MALPITAGRAEASRMLSVYGTGPTQDISRFYQQLRRRRGLGLYTSPYAEERGLQAIYAQHRARREQQKRMEMEERRLRMMEEEHAYRMRVLPTPGELKAQQQAAADDDPGVLAWIGTISSAIASLGQLIGGISGGI